MEKFEGRNMSELTAMGISQKMCPLLTNPPSAACYCVKLTSQCVENAIYYCGNSYGDCEIYQTLFVKT